MVVIRLARGGAKKSPFYHIVVANKTSPRDGHFIERVGYFNPLARGKESRLFMNKERIEHWISKGAQRSNRVQHLFKAFLKQDEAVMKAALSRKEQKIAQQRNGQQTAEKSSTQQEKTEDGQ